MSTPNRDGVWISDLNWYAFLRFYFSVSSRPYLTKFQNTSTSVKNTPLRVVLSTFFAVFGHLSKHSLSCLMY